MNRARHFALITVPVCVALLSACGGDKELGEPFIAKTPVTLATADRQRVDAIETTVGRLESVSAPALAAETSGRVLEINVDGGNVVKKGQVLAVLEDEPQRLAVASAKANVERLEALLINQERTVKRYEELRSQAVSESMLEEAIAQTAARRAELLNARAQLAEAEYRLRRTRIRAPEDAIVERRLVSAGDFVSPGARIVTIVGRDRMHAILPFPEQLSGQLRTGLAVTLEQPANPENTLTGAITEVRPMVGTNNRAVEALVELPAGINWPPGGSVNAQVILASREGVVVPTACVVRRPAGEVVYVLDGEQVSERKVTVGIRDSKRAEILTGVQAGETVIESGAGFLTDGALVSVRGTDSPE